MSKNTSELFRKAVLVALGATAVTVEKLNKVVDELVEKGEMSESQANDLKEEVKVKAKAEKEAFETKMSDSLQKAISKTIKEMGIATVTDLEALEKRINAKIENKLGTCCEE